MKNIFILLLFTILSVSIKIPYTNWEWDIDLDLSWLEDLKQKLNTKIPDYISKLKGELEDFVKKNEKQKTAFLEELNTKVKDIYDNVKTNKEKYLKSFIEEATKAAKYISYKVCDAADMGSYEECRKNKKLLFSKIVDKVNDVIGIVNQKLECSKLLGIITSNTQLSSDMEDNMKHILFLVNYISSNPDAIEKGKAQAMYDAVNCLQDNFGEYWNKINATVTDKEYLLKLKKDATNLLIQAASNLVGVIHYEELDGYIKAASEKTGLISSENAKKIHQNLFKLLKKLNEFGSSVYNISANVYVDVKVNPGEKELGADGQIFITALKDKGIKIALNSNYLLKNYKATSIQSVIFDSPLVSIRGARERQGGTSNIFAGITLYDKDGNEILVQDINVKYKPIIYYKKKLFNALTTCLFYNEKEDKLENTGVETETETIDGEEFIKCIPKHLTSFTIGSYSSASTAEEGTSALTVVLIILLCLVLIAAIAVGFIYFRKRMNKVDNSQFDQAFPHKDGLLQ